ncbi:hypothetical protein [Cellulosimicrobium sp. Marseille-Q4280]|uniref:hypothetical protein n=1 Tax=Cellulosimicrobium sp. Marseille-Q4280 TaxID=2937992 RepID=UPI00203B8CD0|nr:hypothetical protein [Cellulosimicrobium sp. Marseille-Q4280]
MTKPYAQADTDEPMTTREKVKVAAVFVAIAALGVALSVTIYRSWVDFGHAQAAKSTLQTSFTALRTEQALDPLDPTTVDEIEQVTGQDLSDLGVTMHEVDGDVCFQTGDGRHTFSMTEPDLQLVEDPCP